MDVLLLIGVVVGVAWVLLCLLVVAVCASAKEGDCEKAMVAPDVVLEPRSLRAPALS